MGLMGGNQAESEQEPEQETQQPAADKKQTEQQTTQTPVPQAQEQEAVPKTLKEIKNEQIQKIREFIGN